MGDIEPMTAQRLHFTVLRGSVGAELDGETVVLGGAMQRKLLAALLADHDTVVNADRLVESIWATDTAPDGARKTVMTYVSRLRSAIGGDHVLTRDGGYQLLFDGATYDADEFEFALAEARAAESHAAIDQYDRALAMWTGRAFGDEGAEGWIRPVAARLEELRLVAQAERAEQLLANGRHAELVADLEQLVTEQPLREHFVDQLMRALYLSGRQAEALRAFHRFREYLADETGLDPSEELVDLERRITLGDASLASPAGVAVPGYELGEVIGVGAFGSVHRAAQPSVGREVAIKVIQPELADDPQFVQRFEAEAQLVARIEHPHVVPLYDYWRRPGGAFLVFRLLRGGTLEGRIADGPLPLAEVARIVEEMCDALAAAHALGVVHRDVKPANVLFDEAGNSYLADFGIAVDAAVPDDPALRSAGSPMYASPEQARDGVATAASDQYALAVVAWEALSATAPFSGSSNTEVLRSKFATALPDLDAPDVPPAVNAVLQRATAPNPADRYPSIGDLADAWRTAIGGAAADLGRTTGNLGGEMKARGSSATMASLPVVGANPFKGLRAFREADAAEFFGRSELVDRLIQTVSDQSFVTVVGPSGSGKSSLVHAGLVPHFRRRGALVVSMVPGTDPLAELESALRRVATVDDETAIAARLLTPGGLAAVAADLVEPSGELVLVIDQFEELFTLVSSEVARDRFADLLVRGASGSGPLRVVATLRADLYDRPLQHPAVGPLVSDSTFAVTAMSAAELAEAVERPAEAVGVRFEPGLVATIVNEVGSRPGALPLLQFTLTELFELRTNATITTRSYEELGGLVGALASRAEQLYRDLAPDRHDDVRRLFLQLVTAGEGSEDFRRRATPPELEGIDRKVIDAYRQNRLLVTDHHPITREPTLEVAHEALLREWPRLRTWIDGARGTIRQRRTLEADAAEWDQQCRDESALLRGTRLVAATEVAQEAPLTKVEREFLVASDALADRERAEAEARLTRQTNQNRRLRRLIAGVAIALVAAMIAGLVAADQRGAARDAAGRAERSAEESNLRRLVAESERAAATSPDLSMLLAVEAAKRSPGPQAAGALATALLTDPDLVRYEGDVNAPRIVLTNGEPGDFLAFSPDSTQLAVPDSEAGEIRVVDVLSGEEERRLPIPSFDGETELLGVSWDGADTIDLRTVDSIAAIDAQTGTVRLPPTAIGTIVDSEASPDGLRLAVLAFDEGTTDATLTIIDRDGGRREATVPCCSPIAWLGASHREQRLGGSVAWRGRDLYVASGSGALVQIDPDTGETMGTVEISLPWVLQIDFSADGGRLHASGQLPQDPVNNVGSPGVLQAYDTDDWAPRWTSPPDVSGYFVDDPRHGVIRAVSTYSGSNGITIDRGTGEVLGRTFVPTNGSPCLLHLSPDARFLAAEQCGREGKTIWSLDGDSTIGRKVAPAIGAGDAPYTTLTLDERRAVVNVDSFKAYDIDLATGATTVIPDVVAGLVRHDGRMQIIDPNGIPGISDGAVEVPSEPFEVTWASEPTVQVNDLDLDATYDLIAVGPEDNQSLVIYRGVDVLGTIPPGGTRTGFSVLGATNRVLMSAGQGDVQVYPLDDLDDPTPAGFDARLLATSPSKELLAVLDPDGSIDFRDTKTLERTGPSILGAANISHLTLTPDEETLVASSGSDESLQLYDVATATPMGPPLPVDENWTPVAPSRDSTWMLLWRSGSLVKLSIDRDEWLGTACQVVGRNLTKAEWETYIGGTPRATCPQWPAPR